MTATNYDLWEKGVGLRSSTLAFAPQAEKDEYARIYEKTSVELLRQGMKAAADAGLVGMEAVGVTLDAVNPIATARSDWHSRMHKFVRNHLSKGNLLGYGFEPPRTMASQPFEIPKTCWTGRIQWDKDALSSDGLEFAHIRLLTKEARSKLQIPKIEMEPIIKTGRPSIREHIQDAFDALAANGLIDTSAAARNHFGLIRDWLRTNKPDAGYTDGTPSNEGIRAHFSPLFNELRKNRKQ